MKKLNILMIIMLVMSSCQMFLLDSSEWTGPTRRKGQSDYGIRIAEDTILENPKTIKKIGGYSIPMPENIIFKYGSSAYGLDVIFGKKRKYLYNTQTGNGTQVYLIEETMESLKNEVYGKKGDRYRVRYGARGGVLIGIKPNIFILCSTLDSDPHTGYPDCEAIVKVMKGE